MLFSGVFIKIKRSVINIFVVILISASLSAQIPNEGFENWTNYSTYDSPDSWGNTNYFTQNASLFACVKGYPGQTGSFYTMLNTTNVPGKGIVPGIIVSGTLDTVTFKALSGFPFSSRPQTLDYYVQFMPASENDTGFISLVLTKWNNAVNKRDTVAFGKTDLLGMAHSWFLYSTWLSYLSGNNPDTAVITISASGMLPEAGSYLYIDQLSFSGNVIGIQDNSANGFLNVFPNPFSSKLQFKFQENETASKMIIFDAVGKILYENECSQGNLEISTEYWPAGIYTIKTFTNKYSLQRKIVKSR